jgi:hypothetical protein
VAYQERGTRRRGIGGWSATTWIVLAIVVAAIAVGIVLAVIYTGGSGGGRGY